MANTLEQVLSIKSTFDSSGFAAAARSAGVLEGDIQKVGRAFVQTGGDVASADRAFQKNQLAATDLLNEYQKGQKTFVDTRNELFAIGQSAQLLELDLNQLADGFGETQIKVAEFKDQGTQARKIIKDLAKDVRDGKKTTAEASAEYAKFATNLKRVELPDGLTREMQRLASEVRSGAKSLDAAQRELEQYELAVQKAAAATDKLGKESQQSGQQVKKSSSSSGDGAQNFQKLKSSITSAIATYVTLQTAMQAAEFVSQGADIDATVKKFDKLSTKAGVASDVLLGRMRQATRGTVDDFTLMRSASDLLNLGIAGSADEVTRFSRLIGGLNWDPDVLNLTIANQSTQRLDSLGIGIDDLKKRAKELADQGYSTEQAFKFALLAAGEAKLETIGSSSDDASVKIDQLKTITENWTNAARLAALDGAEPLIDALLRLQDASDFDGSFDIGDLGASSSELKNAAEEAGVAVEQIEALATAFANSGLTKNQSIEIAIDVAKSGDDIENLNLTLAETAARIEAVKIPGSLQGQVGQLGESLRAVTGDSEQARQIMTALYDEFGRSESEVQALQTAVFLLSNGYDVTTDSLIEQSIALAKNESPLQKAVELLESNSFATSELGEQTRRLADGYSAELDPALADHHAAVADGTAQIERLTAAEGELLSQMLQNLGGVSAVERAVINKSIADQDSSDTIFGLIQTYSDLDSAQIVSLNRMLQIEAELGLLNASNEAERQQIVALTAEYGVLSSAMSVNTDEIIKNAQATNLRIQLAAALGNASRAAGSNTTFAEDEAYAQRETSGITNEQISNINNLTSAIESIGNVASGGGGSGGGGGGGRSARAELSDVEKAQQELAAAREQLISDVYSAEKEVAELRRRENKDIAALRSKQTDDIAELEAETNSDLADLKKDKETDLAKLKADNVTEIGALEAAQVDDLAKLEAGRIAELAALEASYNDDKARMQRELYEERARLEAEFQQQAAQRLLELGGQEEFDLDAQRVTFLQDLIDSGRTAEEIGEIAQQLDVMDAAAAAAAARRLEFEQLRQAIAEADLSPDEEIAAFQELENQFNNGQALDLSEYEVSVKTAAEKAVEATKEKNDEILALDEQLREARTDVENQFATDKLAIEEKFTTDKLAIDTQYTADKLAIDTQHTADKLAIETATQTAISTLQKQTADAISAEYVAIVAKAQESGIGQAEAWSIVSGAIGGAREQVAGLVADASAIPPVVLDIIYRYTTEGSPPPEASGVVPAAGGGNGGSGGSGGGSGGGATPQNLGGRQRRGSPYIVGDGPGGRITPFSELIVPDQSGLVVGNNQVQTALRVFEQNQAIHERFAQARPLASGGRFSAGESLLVGDRAIGGLPLIDIPNDRFRPNFSSADAAQQLGATITGDSNMFNITINMNGGARGDGRAIADEVRRQVMAAMKSVNTRNQSRRLGGI